LPRDNEAILGAAPLDEAGVATYDFTLRYYDVQGIDTASLNGADVLVTGPNGYSTLATLVEIEAEDSTTAGTARTVRYQVAGPGGAWDSNDGGNYTVTLRPNQVRDTTGAYLPSAILGGFQANITSAAAIDVGALLAEGDASVVATTWDIGSPQALFDGNPSSLYRTQNINPAVVTLSFDDPQTVEGVRVYLLGGPHNWTVEAANSLADLNGHTGTYQLLVSELNTPSDMYSEVSLGALTTATHFRLTVERLTGDDYVHITSWDFLGPAVTDVAAPSATLLSAVPAVTGGSSTSFTVRYTDDVSLANRSINFGDVRVTGPNGFVQTAGLYDVNIDANGTPRDVTYFISAPGGGWDVFEDGSYTIHVVAGQVFDTSRNAVSAGAIGSFTVNVPPIQTRPPDDMTELNADDWFAFAESATASTSDDTVRTTFGAGSVRFDTTGGFDTYLRYAPASGTLWDLTDASDFHFDVYAENPSAFDFQQEPIVRFIDADGDAMEFRYYLSNSPYPLWNNAIGGWLSQTISIKSLAQPATGWRGAAIGTPDWTRMSTVEIHADTWDFGFTLWFDRVGFNLAGSGATASMAVNEPMLEDLQVPSIVAALNSIALSKGPSRGQREVNGDSHARHAAFVAWLATCAGKLREDANSPEPTHGRQQAAPHDSDYEDIDAVFEEVLAGPRDAVR
jgi:hypothetical protein